MVNGKENSWWGLWYLVIFSGKLWTSILMILNPGFLRDGNFWAVLMWYFSSCDLILENYILQGDEANLFRSLGWVGGQHRNVLNSLTPEISTQKMQNPWNWGVGGNESVVHRNQFWFVNFNLTLHCVCHFSSVFLIFWYGEKLWSVYGTLRYLLGLLYSFTW